MPIRRVTLRQTQRQRQVRPSQRRVPARRGQSLPLKPITGLRTKLPRHLPRKRARRRQRKALPPPKRKLQRRPLPRRRRPRPLPRKRQNRQPPMQCHPMQGQPMQGQPMPGQLIQGHPRPPLPTRRRTARRSVRHRMMWWMLAVRPRQHAGQAGGTAARAYSAAAMPACLR